MARNLELDVAKSMALIVDLEAKVKQHVGRVRGLESMLDRLGLQGQAGVAQRKLFEEALAIELDYLNKLDGMLVRERERLEILQRQLDHEKSMWPPAPSKIDI